jgi:zinc transporter ZupT
VTLVFYKAAAALLIFIVSMATVIYPLKKKSALHHPESVELGEALASGIFLGAAFFHMLPESIRAFNRIYSSISYPIPEMICVGGFLLMLLLERLSLTNETIRTKNSIPYIIAIILIIHAVTEGAALGIGYTLSETIMIFIAIMAHKGSESFALCMTLLKHQLPFKQVLFLIIFFALMTPLGIALGVGVSHSDSTQNGALMSATLNAFAAGTFLYISTLHHIHFHQHSRDARGMLEFGCLAAGLAAMGLIALWA